MLIRGFLGLLLLCGAAAEAADLVSLETRPGVQQRFILIEPEGEPVASVVLFPGGKGALQLSSVFGHPTMQWGKNNFLVRTREQFAAQGMLVTVVDAPSDMQSSTGMLGGFRASAEHVVDIDSVIAYLRAKTEAPVWLIGTSRGTESAAHVAIHSTQTLGGLVLTSSMTVPNSDGVAITDMDLDRVQIPTLVVAHVADGCNKTPPAGAQQISESLTNASAVEVRLFDGGDTPRSKPCQAMSQHGFLGIEAEVVTAISRFIRSH